MECRMCRFWLRDFSFPDGIGYCNAKSATTPAPHSCELFRRKEEESIAVKVLYY
ncbi:hypothetical protein [Archaeoglobus neptunius]|uniref:hypothetical protein n=1 Tax=Archaeoglobus neptunius TaxID=2798580 RepID=UPI001928BF16|nr:hypothetical protein [Archaeoglobus neptunius]